MTNPSSPSVLSEDVVEALTERLRAFTQAPDNLDDQWRDRYPEIRREEIESFILSITPSYAKDVDAYPLHYIAQMLATQSYLSPPQGSYHHSTALAAETLIFYAERLASLQTASLPTPAETQGESWQPIETAPHAMHFLAAYFYPSGGEWIFDIAMMHHNHACGTNEGSGPFTHWRPLPEPPRSAALRGQP